MLLGTFSRWNRQLLFGALPLLVAFTGCSGSAQESRAERLTAFRKKNQLSSQVKEAIEKPDRFVLYSLDPESHNDSTMEGAERFHDFTVLGSTEVKHPKARRELVDALQRGIAESEGKVALCFEPRHGIRVECGNQTIDLVICFECMSISVYVNGQEEQGVWLTSSPQPTFDAALKAANVTLPAQAD